jgi:hypothetical protein
VGLSSSFGSLLDIAIILKVEDKPPVEIEIEGDEIPTESYGADFLGGMDGSVKKHNFRLLSQAMTMISD